MSKGPWKLRQKALKSQQQKNLTEKLAYLAIASQMNGVHKDVDTATSVAGKKRKRTDIQPQNRNIKLDTNAAEQEIDFPRGKLASSKSIARQVPDDAGDLLFEVCVSERFSYMH